MLSVQPLKSAHGAADYYAAAFNYYAGDAQALRWLGQGSQGLGLTGIVQKEQMLALLEGKLPSGQILQNKKGEHRPGFDMTFSAPKSVSILAGLGADLELETLHDQAVEKAVRLIEKEFAQARVVIDGKVHYVNTGNLIIAAFRQPSSRANDPALHTHCVTMNITFTEEGKARSLASDMNGHFGVIEQLQRHVTYAGLLYRTELANLLKERGYRLRDIGKGMFEIEGMPDDVLKEFSTRRADIEAKMLEEGWEGPRLAHLATLLTRNQKEEHDIEVLQADWQKRADILGFDAQQFVAEHKTHTQELEHPGFLTTLKEKLFSRFYEKQDLQVMQAKEAVFVAIEIMAQQESVFSQRKLKEHALRHTLTDKTIIPIAAVDKAIEDAIQNQTLYRATDPIARQNMLTTPWALTLETETLARIEANKNCLAPLANEQIVIQAQKDYEAQSSFQLTPSQRKAMLHVFTTKDRFNAIQGYAGTGKTTLLKLTTQLAEAKGFTVRGLAVTSSAVNELRAKAAIHADVFPLVHQELLKAPDNSRRKTLFILDEGSLLSTIQGHELIKLIEQKGARLFLVGDDAQLPSVKCGRIFGQAQEYGLQTSQLTDIIRQKNESLKGAVQDTLRGDLYDSLQKLNEVRELDTHEARIEAVAHHWLSLSPRLREETLVFAPTHANRRAITQLIREQLKEEGTLSSKTIVLNTLNAKIIEEVQFHHSHYYQAGDVLRFNIRLRMSGIQPGEYLTIAPITAKHRKNKTVPLINSDGKTTTLWLKDLPQYKPTRAGLNRLIECYEPTRLELCENDKVLVTRNNRPKGLVNSSLAFVKAITEKELTLEFEQDSDEKIFSLDCDELKHLDHGYVLTTMKSQGKDKTYALGLMESYNQFSATLKQYYVQISRAIVRMTLITDNTTRLLEALEFNEDTKKTALSSVSTNRVMAHQTRFAAHVKSIPITEVVEQKAQQEQLYLQKQNILVHYAQAKEEKKTAVAALWAHQIVCDKTLKHMARHQLTIAETTLRLDALKFETAKQLKHLSVEEQKKLLTVKNYVELCHQSQKAWKSVHQGNKTALQKQIAFDTAGKRDAFAYQIAERIEDYKPYLHYFSIGKLNRLGVSQYRIAQGEERAKIRLENLNVHAEKQQLAMAITSFFKEKDTEAKQKLGATLRTQSKAVHPYLIRLSETSHKPLDSLWLEINQQARAFADKQFRANLKPQEKAAFDRIQSYKALNCELAIHRISQLYCLEKGKAIPEALELKQQEYSRLRNEIASLAQDNSSFAKVLHYFKIAPEKLTKQAANHDKYQTVLSFKQAQANFKLKREVVVNIAEDIKGHYPFIKSLNIDTRLLHTFMRIEARQLFISELSEDLKADYLKLIDYKIANRKAGIVWKAIFSAKEQGKVINERKLITAQLLTAKRDSLAHELKAKPELQPFLEQEKLNSTKMNTHATQHQARRNSITELNTLKEQLLGQLKRRESQMNKQEAYQWHKAWQAFNQQLERASRNQPLYQSVIEKTGNSPFIWTESQKTLLSRYELEKPFTHSPKIYPKPQAKISAPKENLDATLIIEAMLANPIETYRAIWGEPKKITSREMRYSGGLVITLKGSKVGFWYDFREDVGGSPLQALMQARGLSFKEALKEGAMLSGTHGLASGQLVRPPKRQPILAPSQEENNKIISAKSILKGGIPIQGTLAERYLKEHRGIEHPERLKVLFWPKGATWQATDDNGKLYEKINKISALLIAAKNEKNEVTGVQRVYLDEKTAKKNTFMENAKLSKGKIEGSSGLLQRGEKLGTVYLVEGPETGASIAMANPKATVLVSFGLANLKNLSHIIKSFYPKEVIIAGDNDTLAKTNKTTKTDTLKITQKAQEALKNEGIHAKLIIPQPLPGKEKTDWNDVHRSQGLVSVQQQLDLALNNPLTDEMAKQFKIEQQNESENYSKHFRTLQHQGQEKMTAFYQNSDTLKSLDNTQKALEKVRPLERNQREIDLDP
ncbi:MobF family relaxase [Legionella sp.]|uniref:MobF family relaxase n=1 Tax=Legionella sp. TaxID=459 RepID=UPI0032204579